MSLQQKPCETCGCSPASVARDGSMPYLWLGEPMYWYCRLCAIDAYAEYVKRRDASAPKALR